MPSCLCDTALQLGKRVLQIFGQTHLNGLIFETYADVQVINVNSVTKNIFLLVTRDFLQLQLHEVNAAIAETEEYNTIHNNVQTELAFQDKQHDWPIGKSSSRAAWINYIFTIHFTAVPVMFAERGVTADPFARKLVDPLCS